MQAFGLAILIEVAVLAATVAILGGGAAMPPMQQAPMAITLVSVRTPPPAPVPPKSESKPKPKRPKPRQPAPEPKPIVPTPIPQAPAPVAQRPDAFSQPPSLRLPPASPVPPVTQSKPDPGIEYAAKVRAAVQAAVYYPPAAAVLRFAGRVRVEFHLFDATPGAARVLVSSGIGLFDRAALRTVQRAHYPAPPQDLRGSDRVYQIWVDFDR